jgi:membrane-bound lytic murein transglycosylase D
MPIPRLTALLLVVLAANFPAGLVVGDTQAILFPRPPGFAPAVAFWTRVYTNLDSASGIIHDNRQLDVIYQILYLNPDAPPAAQTKVIEKTIEDYRTALLALASGKRRGLTAIEQQALLPWGENASEVELQAAAERLRFQRGQADRFEQGLARSARWKKHIQEVFRKRDLPPELSALPHVESSYNPGARSKAGAAGLWQFMPATARRYLRVDAAVDERLDPYKSSEAAAHLLQHNHSVLKSWPLAITAYNHGLSGVRRAVRETGTENLDEIVRTYEGPRFGFASRNFYAAFLVVVDVSENPERYFGGSQQEVPEPIILVTPAYLPAEVLVEAFGVDKKQLRELNPSLHHGVWNGAHFVPRDHALKLPGTIARARAEEILAQLAQHFGFSSQVPYRYYEVRSGDTLSLIAERQDTNTQTLRSMNRLGSAHQIHAGQVLRVPMGPIPEPLGAGAAVMLAAQRTKGGIEGGSALALNVPRLVAGAAGQASLRDGVDHRDSAQSRLPADACREASSEVPSDDSEGLIEMESAMAASPTQTQPALAADPVDYGVAADGTVEIQINETLGHYAEWLDLRSDRLRKLNNLAHKQPLIVGRRLKLDFSHATAKRFEQQRIAYHQSLQLEYFRRYRIVGVLEHAIIVGDNLWMLAVQQYQIPMWLLRQYNPDIDVDTVLPIDSLIFVPVVAALPNQPRCVVEEANEGSDRDA